MKGFHLSLPKVIVRRWRTFLLSGTATALVFALGYLAQPIRYEAFGVYTPKPTGPDSEQNTGQRRPSLLRQTVDILLLRDNNLTPEALAIKDDEILQAVIKELEIRDWGGNPASPRSLRRRIRLSNDDRDGAVRVSLHDPTPELAKQIIDRLMAGYVEYYAGQTPEATISVTSVIQPQLIKANTLRKQNQKALYQIQLGSTQLQPESTRTGDQTIDLKAIEISVQQQISTIDADLATLRQVQEKSSGAQTTMVRQFISLAEVRKQLLNRLRETLNMPRDDQSLSTQLELLERQGLTLAKELTLTQNQYTRFLERQQTNWSITQSTQPQVRILSAAILPAQGTRPFRPWFIVLGLCSSVGLGTLTCLLRERQDSSLLSLSDIYAQAQLPILGLIPKFSDQDLLTQALARQQTSELQESSQVMEGYHQSIEYLSRGSLERIPQVLAFTSVSVDEGKSLTVANLAYIFAKSGKKVLLLEADLYEPQQPQIWNVAAAVGLCECLAGDIQVGKALQRIRPNLDLLQAGKTHKNKDILLNSPGISILTTDFRSRYDHILVDTPAITDSIHGYLFANCSDATVLVLNPAQSNRTHIQHLRETLDRSNHKLWGMILDGVEASWRSGQVKALMQESQWDATIRLQQQAARGRNEMSTLSAINPVDKTPAMESTYLEPMAPDAVKTHQRQEQYLYQLPLEELRKLVNALWDDWTHDIELLLEQEEEIVQQSRQVRNIQAKVETGNSYLRLNSTFQLREEKEKLNLLAAAYLGQRPALIKKKQELKLYLEIFLDRTDAEYIPSITAQPEFSNIEEIDTNKISGENPEYLERLEDIARLEP